MKMFNTSEKLQSHMKDSHNPEQSFMCDTCGKACGSSSALHQHVKRHKSIVCSMCGRCFNSKEELNEHRKLHLKFSCEECGQIFTCKNDVKRHMLTIHNEGTVCFMCKKHFSSEMEAYVKAKHPEILSYL